MIRNNLALIMATQQKRIGWLSNETKISRNTISATMQNEGKMIQLATINKICQALKITPDDLFDYVPFDFDYSFNTDSKDIGGGTDQGYRLYTADFFINVYENNVKATTISFTGNFEMISAFPNQYTVSLYPIDDENLGKYNRYLLKLSSAFTADIDRTIEKFIADIIKPEEISPDSPFEFDVIVSSDENFQTHIENTSF